MLSIIRAIVERLKALVITSAALELEAQFVAHDAERRAELLRQADRYDADGLRGIAQHLRQQAEHLSAQRPLASVLPAVAHLHADLEADADTAALSAQDHNILPGPAAPPAGPDSVAPEEERRQIVIEITRMLARQLRAVLRKSTPTGAPRGYRPPLVFQTGHDGLRVRARHPEVAVEYHLPGPRSPEVIALPGEVLDDIEGGKEAAVALEKSGPQAVEARWDDGGVPQVRDYPAGDSDKGTPFPGAPAKFTELGPEFLKVLHDAVQTAAREDTRYALQKLQLRGDRGELIASDGHQLLVQRGFTFPWKEDVLVPAVGIFGCRELPEDTSVAIGKTDKEVCIRVGPWSFFLAIDKDGRFPKVENILPSTSPRATIGRVPGEDAAFLLKTLPRLPGRDEDNARVTIDLNGHVAVRARAEGQSRVTEITLNHSEVTGPSVRLVTNRLYLARAMQLGFAEFHVASPDVPVVCREEHRTYGWMPLGKEGALAPSEDAIRLVSQTEDPSPPLQTQRRKVAMSTPQANGRGNGHAAPRHDDTGADEPVSNGKGLGPLIQEAQALKDALREAYGRSNCLLVALKRHRKQSKLMQTTLASLRQLQQIDGELVTEARSLVYAGGRVSNRAPGAPGAAPERGGYMAKGILMEEFHLTVFAPRGLRDSGYDTIRRTLDDRRFHADLRRAVRGVVHQHPSLTKVRITVTR